MNENVEIENKESLNTLDESIMETFVGLNNLEKRYDENSTEVGIRITSKNKC